MPFILVDHLKLYFRLRRSQRAKRLQLLFHYDGFEVVAPPCILNKEIVSFIAERQSWMKRVFQRAVQQEKAIPRHFKQADNSIFYRGQAWRLEIRYQEGFSVEMQSENILAVTSPQKESPGVEAQLLKWVQQQTEAIIRRVVETVCPLLGRWPRKIVLREQKTRWGSCGINNTIQINKRLIFAPEGVLEYIVVHELCHLIHRHHGPRFWRQVEQYCPDYQRHRVWLRIQGGALMSIGMELSL